MRNRIRRTHRTGAGIFLNIPYSNRYSSFEVAIISTVTAYGLIPRMARERVGLEIRAQKIFELILSCDYGVTDLSYQRRMNMPLELGLLLALAKRLLLSPSGSTTRSEASLTLTLETFTITAAASGT